MGTITKEVRKSGKIKWKLQIRKKGWPSVCKTFNTQQDALDYQLWYQSKIKFDPTGPSQFYNKQMTVSQVIERYKSEILPHKSNGMRAAQEKQLNWWKKEMGNVVLGDLNPGIISALLAKLSKTNSAKGMPFKPASVNRFRSAISHVFSVARADWNLIGFNPVEGVRKLKENNERKQHLNKEEKELLLEACKSSQSKLLYPLVLTALTTGCRKGEILNLTWSDVDLKRKRLYILATKNGESRSQPITAKLVEVLQGLKPLKVNPTRLVFSGGNPLRPFDPKRSFATAMKLAGIKDFTFHDLRHTFASDLAMSGASEIQVMKLMGHKDPKMVLRYAHLFEDHLGDLVEGLKI